jgi:membrane protein involved in colicin uptake
LLAKALVPGLAAIKGVQNFFDPPTKSYAKSRDEMTPAEKAYADNTQASVTDEMIAAAEANDAGKNAEKAAAYGSVNDFGGPGTSTDPGFDAGYGGYGMGFAEGGALRFAEGDVVPDPRIYPEPVVNPLLGDN